MNEKDKALEIVEGCSNWSDIQYRIIPRIEAALTTASKEARESGWLPIDTAPKDGTRVLLVHGNYIWLDTWWKGDGTNSDWSSIVAWRQATGKAPDAPTHWMPLPRPPIEAAANTEEGGASEEDNTRTSREA